MFVSFLSRYTESYPDSTPKYSCTHSLVSFPFSCGLYLLSSSLIPCPCLSGTNTSPLCWWELGPEPIPIPSEPTADQNIDTPQSSLVESIIFIKVAYRNTGEWFLTGADITQRQLHHRSPIQHEWQLTKLGTCSTLQSLQAVQQIGEGPYHVPQLV